VAVVVGIETYRSTGIDGIANVPYACADAEEFASSLRGAFSDVEVDVQLLVNENASLISLRENIGDRIQALRDNDLFVFYYAGHGFCGNDGNRLAAWDMSRLEITDTTLLLRDEILEPLRRWKHAGSLMFLDACAAGLSAVRCGEIDNLDAAAIEASLDAGLELGLDEEDVCGVLSELTAEDSAGRVASAATGEWMYLFKPQVFETILFVKVILRNDCAVVSFHEDEDGSDEDGE
jgi:hypothetical protein